MDWKWITICNIVESNQFIEEHDLTFLHFLNNALLTQLNIGAFDTYCCVCNNREKKKIEITMIRS